MTKFPIKDVKMKMKGCELVKTVHNDKYAARAVLSMAKRFYGTDEGFIYEYPDRIYGVYVEGGGISKRR